jgi:hypothetical protein
MPELFVPQKISLKQHTNINETWIQQVIAETPSILGLGDLEVVSKERIQIRGGRLDLLLRDANQRRYEVEIQLGATDASHIIRTLEYYDIEKKRYPQYDHCAVIIAEDITSRFHNVISMFNGFIPLIAIQMAAYDFDGKVALVFTKVLDEMPLGLDEDDVDAAPATRADWVSRSSEETIKIADQLLNLINEFSPDHKLSFTKHYIGLSKDSQSDNFVVLKPRKNNLVVDLRLGHSIEIDAKITAAELDTLEYDHKWKRYRLRLNKKDIDKHKILLKELLEMACLNSK